MKQRLRILFIGTNQSFLFRRWVEWFRDRGHTIGVIGKVKNDIEGVEFFDIAHPHDNDRQRTDLFGIITQIVRIRAAIKKFRPDIVHSHQVFLYGIYVAFVRFHPHVITAYGSDVLINPRKSILLRVLTALALKCCDLITSESEHVIGVCKELGASKQKVKKVLFGVDLEKISTIDKLESCRAKFGLHNRNVIISPRGLGDIYNPTIFLRAIPQVLRCFPDTMFIIKYFSSRDGEEKVKKLKALANEMGIERSNLLFLAEVDYHELLQLYAVSNIFVSIPSSDSLSVSLMEAMVLGSAPVVSDIPANREVISEEINGRIVPLKDISKLSEAIIQILDSPETQGKFKEINRRLALDNFGKDKNMIKMEKYYLLLANRQLPS